MSETAVKQPNCKWCGGVHPWSVCPAVKAYEYYPDGSVKRVEFKTATDFHQIDPLAARPPWLPTGTTWGLTPS